MWGVVGAVVGGGGWLPAARPPGAATLLVTVLPGATPADAKLPVPLHVTTSAPTTPGSVQLIVALDVPSYVLLAAVMAGVRVAAVILAVVVAVVEESA